MKKLIAVLLGLIVLAIPASSLAATDYYGGYYYTMTSSGVPIRFKALTDSQAKHPKGYQTTIGINTAKTNSFALSSSVTITTDFVFIELAGTFGLESSVSHTTGTSVDYTIGTDKPTNWYRIEQKAVGKKVSIVKHTAEPEVIGTQTIAYVPLKYGHYHCLVIFDIYNAGKMGIEVGD
jgi:hypothetical protein